MQSLALLILRLVFGLGIAWHGYLALFVIEGGMAGLTNLVASKNWPAPEAWAYAAKITELAGGALLVLGFLTRAAALASAGTMVVAIWMAHWGQPFVAAPGEQSFELAALYLAAFLALLLLGGGRYGVDGLRRDPTPEPGAPPAPAPHGWGGGADRERED